MLVHHQNSHLSTLTASAARNFLSPTGYGLTLNGASRVQSTLATYSKVRNLVTSPPLVHPQKEKATYALPA